MRNFELAIPTKILFGTGVLEKLDPEAARLGKKALLVYGQGSIKRNGVYDKLMAQLKAVGVEVTEHPGVKPNPVLSHAEKGAALARSGKAAFHLSEGLFP